MTDDELREQALAWIKSHKAELIARFADLTAYPGAADPVSIFMAGSPGAGKTELSKRFIEGLHRPIARLDQDDVREAIPGYDGSNSDLFQKAAIKGIEVLHDAVLSRGQSFLLDTTFSSLDVASRNIQRSLNRGRDASIIFVYQDPVVAWGFTQKREIVEGRRVPKEAFVKGFVGSRLAVNEIKRLFGAMVTLILVQKNHDNLEGEVWHRDIDNLDGFLPNAYTSEELHNLIV